MRSHLSIISLLPILSILLVTTALAKAPPLSHMQKAGIIASLNQTLKANYVFPDVAQKIAPVLDDHLKSGKYDSAATTEELAKTLTLAGFEVESIEDRSTWADGVVVGRVLTRIQHPNADKLSVCTVDVGGEEPLQIVCGAANVRAGILVAVATVGTYLPKVDLKIKPAKLRGEKSEGMICSLSELGLTKDSEGIYIFGDEDSDVPAIGTDVRSLLGLDDVILDLSSTANRADALSMVGIAREVAALTGGTLKLPTVDMATIPAQPQLTVSVSEAQACNIYVATSIQGVEIDGRSGEHGLLGIG